ncbi:carbon-nitrogen family hydrolase [Lysinibacillus capsici]|uniref:carbon-nitrogen family hydrolase n=1 Tax=Lysinibacillus TaxID=400634 RepID=UPI000653FD9F|nr:MULTISPECIES: carbon-nitrogen family hydrolase [Lysinibacillus]KMN39487.1 acyltransferase [Lysinibacillus sp. LK3]MED3873370.1 carbon-nitrogen family hydrolase [Lysinibacillus capsici]WPK03451.1 carbon-nitrogen family hydrolase [Lysinibacillus capsici]
MKIASIQLEIKDQESKNARIDRVEAMIDQLKGQDLIVLPETWATGYFAFDRYVDESEEINGDFVQRFSSKAKEIQSYLFAGSFIERNNGKYYNTSVLFSPEGTLIGTYRKIHLFRYGSQEGKILTRGIETTVVDTDFGKVGLSTCYDLRFPELYRAEVDLGAELLLVTSAWPHARLEHWKIFNTARALENQCFLISSNCVGNTHGIQLGGHSQVVDPWGIVMASGGDEETIVKTEIDPSQIAAIRDAFPNLKHRVLDRQEELI